MPIPDDELEVAANMLSNFTAHWEADKNDLKTQEELIKLIVAYRFEAIRGMSLRPDYQTSQWD